MKAFLSHSSLDKEIVREVSNKLGRLKCIFDEKSFESGKEFKESIETKIANSTVFVFFASKNSLDSHWCKFELDQAFYASLKGTLSRSIVFLLNDDVSLDEIPSWLKTALIKKVSSPSAIARDIKAHLEEAADQFQRPVFLGRARERELIESTLNPFDGSTPPKVLAVFGLPGIGRRSLIRNVSRDLFSLHKCVEVEIESGENIYSLCIKLADLIEPYSCQEELKDIIKEINCLSESDVFLRVINNVESLISANELPMLVDVGGLALDNGCLSGFINKIIDGVASLPDAYICLVLNRRISSDNEVKIDTVSVEQLSNSSTSQLLSKLSQSYPVAISSDDIRELSEYINGYPPAAYFAIKQASIYSVDALMGDKRKLTQFSQKRFITHIQDHNLTDEDVTCLQVLSNYSPLPLECILSLYSCDRNTAHDRVYELIDCSLIRVVDGQLYRIADPIKSAVNEVFGYPTVEALTTVKDRLNDYVSLTQDEHKLEISRVLFRLGFALNDFDAKANGIRFNADYIKLLENAYHQRKYKEAIDIGFEAVAENSDNASARTYLIKALIQEERWEAAEKQLNDLYPTDEYRNIYYLKGFLERKKGDFDSAIKAYKDAENHGRKGFALYREFSHCYLMVGDIESAQLNINKALKIQPNNNQVIDMAVRISISRRDKESAEKYIKQLELLDSSEHYNLRLSAFYLAFGEKEMSLEAARLSVEYGGERFFSGRVQLIKALIKTGRLEEAEAELSKLKSDFLKSKNDIKLALQCSLEFEKGSFLRVLELVEDFINKDSVQYKGIKAKCLNVLSGDVSISYEKRKEYRERLSSLSGFLNYDFNE